MEGRTFEYFRGMDHYCESPAPTGNGVWSILLYILAVIVSIIIFYTYEPKQEKDEDQDPEEIPRKRRPPQEKDDWRLSSLFSVLGLSVDTTPEFDSFTEHFNSFEEVSTACMRAGLKESNLIIGVDFTASNEWQGRKTFNQNCLHKVVGHKISNPYQKVIWILGQTLAPFDQDNLIPAYGFGDEKTTDESVFSFTGDESPCRGFQTVLDRYNDIVRSVTLSGPTSFAPIINKAIRFVRKTRKYHILVIVADGQVNEEQTTIDAIVEASHYPMSIIVVGVGDGPWDVMEEFDHRLPKRVFDNFRFVDYHKTTSKSKNPDTAFALQVLMEIPDQYKKITALGYLDTEERTSRCSDSPTPSHSSYSPKRTPSITSSTISNTGSVRYRTSVTSV